MNFNNHSNLEGQHAFLGASKYHWINYGEDKVAEAYRNFLATQKGTVLHAFAAQCIPVIFSVTVMAMLSKVGLFLSSNKGGFIK